MRKIYSIIVFLACCLILHAQEKKEFRFVNGTTAYFVQGNNGWGVEDINGKELVPKVYKKISYNANLVLCQQRNDGNRFSALYNSKGERILSEDEEYITIDFMFSDGKWNISCFSVKSPILILDENGVSKYRYKTLKSPEGFIYLINELTDTIVIPSGKYTDNFVIKGDIIQTQIGRKHGVANLDGTTVIPANMFGRIIPDYGKGFKVMLAEYGGSGLCGYYDRNGKCIIPANKYTDIYSLPNGVFEVVLDDKAGIVDSLGNIKFMTKYRLLDPAKDEKGNWYYISYLGNGKGKLSLTGKVIEEVKPTIAKKEIASGNFKYVEIRDVNGRYGATTLDGRVIIPNEYDLIKYNHYIKNAFFLEKNGYQGCADSLGNIIIPCKKYDCIINLNTKPYIKVGYRGKYGLCDEKGNEIIRPLFDDVEVSRGEFVVRMGIMKGLLDSTGKLLIPFEYTGIQPEITYPSKMKTGNYEVDLFRKRGICDKNGKIIVPPHYTRTSITSFVDGNSSKKIRYYVAEDGETKGIFSIDGKMLFPAGLYKYATISMVNNPQTNSKELGVRAWNRNGGDLFFYDFNGNLLSSITEKDKQYQKIFGQGQSEFYAKNYKQAIETFQNALTIKQDAAAYFNIGASYYHLGKYKDAIKQLKICLNMNPSPSLSDNASSLIIDCQECQQQKRERHANFWLGILGTALNVAATVIHTNNALHAYNSSPQLASSNSSGFKRDTKMDFLLDPRYTMMQIQQQNWNEYLQMTNGGRTMTYEEWYALKSQALAESQGNGGSSGSLSSSTSSSYSSSHSTTGSSGKMCSLCAGTGDCKTCSGKGWYYNSFDLSKEVLCPNCHNHNGKCSSCGGTGYL